MIERVVLGFGSNLGNRMNNLSSALREISLNKGFDLLAVSSVYETEPWGFKKQNKFLNFCGVFLCRLAPLDVFKTIKSAEKKLGRKSRGKWKAREIDIDVLFYGTSVFKTKELVIPHPFLRERNFVLKPLVELIPGYIHPVFKKRIDYLFRNTPDKGKAELFKRF